jgi:hypothetical protein
MKTSEYYAENPEAKRKKGKYDKKFNKKPEQRKKRADLNKENRKRGDYGNGDGMDLSHTKSGLVKKKASVNRASKSDTAGDKRARGKK